MFRGDHDLGAWDCLHQQRLKGQHCPTCIILTRIIRVRVIKIKSRAGVCISTASRKFKQFEKKNHKITWIYPRNWSFTSISETFLTMQELIISPIKKAAWTSFSEPRWCVWKIVCFAFGLCRIQTCINSSTQVDKNKQSYWDTLRRCAKWSCLDR